MDKPETNLDSDYLKQGRNLTPAEAAELENALMQSNHDVKARLQLIGFYRGKGEEESVLRMRHVIWMIDHYPADEIWRQDLYMHPGNFSGSKLFDSAKEHWNEQLVKFPNNADVFGNAGLFQVESDFDAGTRLLLYAVQIDTDDYSGSYWPQRLCHFFFDRALETTGDAKSELASDALRIGETFLRRLGTEGMLWRTGIRLFGLEACALCAMWTNDDLKIQKYVIELRALLASWDFTPRSSQLILGLLSLREGEIEKAAEYLLSSESPGIDTLELELANKLIEAGQTKAVLDYLLSCQQNDASSDLNSWILCLESGAKVALQRASN